MATRPRKALREPRPPPNTSLLPHIVTCTCSILYMGRSNTRLHHIVGYLMIKASWHLDLGLSSLDDQRLCSLQNLEYHLNVLRCSLAHFQHFLKISLISIQSFSTYFGSQIHLPWRRMHTFPVFIHTHFLKPFKFAWLCT